MVSNLFKYYLILGKMVVLGTYVRWCGDQRFQQARKKVLRNKSEITNISVFIEKLEHCLGRSLKNIEKYKVFQDYTLLC